MLTVLVSKISNSQIFFAKKIWRAFTNAKATRIFFSKNISIYMYAIFNDQRFNDTLTKDIVSFEQLSPDPFHSKKKNALSEAMTVPVILEVSTANFTFSSNTPGGPFFGTCGAWFSTGINILYGSKMEGNLCWGFTAQSTQWGQVECCQFT